MMLSQAFRLAFGVLCVVFFTACGSGGGGGGGGTPVADVETPIEPSPVDPPIDSPVDAASCTLENTSPTFNEAAPARFSSVAPDADTSGTLGTTDAIRYDFDDVLVSDPETNATYLAEVEGWIRYPTSTPPTDGWPVVMYLHGRHSTCRYADSTEFLGTECPDTAPSGSPLVVTAPVESFQGYDYMAENLASHGYIVISGDANDVNDRDLAGDAGVTARSQIILATLDNFRDINNNNRTTDDGDVPDGVTTINDFSALVGAADFSRVGLMGHSRGGQAVGHVVRFNRDPANRGAEGEINAPHNLVAIFSLAPTDFDEITVPDTTFATLLPYCDGDVSNLQGARTYDNSRYVEDQNSGTLIQVLTLGTNHNFYNTIWTGDDYGNGLSFCSSDAADSGRDTPEEQRRHGEFLMSSFFRLFVGGETQFQEYWEGDAQLPASACPLDDSGNAEFPCDDRVMLSILAKPDNRIVIDDFTTDDSLTQNDVEGESTGVTTLTGFSDTSHCRPTTGGADCPSDPTYSRAGQLAVSWDSVASYATRFDELDVTTTDHFTMRAGVNEDDARNPGSQDFGITLTDCAGRTSSEVLVSNYSDALFAPPGDVDNGEGRKLTQNGIMVPLSAFSGVDLSRLTGVDLTFDQTSQGDVQFTDIVFQNIGEALTIPQQ